jgi:hypothetical protein
MALPFETARHQALRKLAAERFGTLTAQEDEILRRSSSTDNTAPVAPAQRPEVRAAFLRWLATDTGAAAQIDTLGLRAAGVTVTSDLDLEFCRLPFPLRFDNCSFEGGLLFRQSEIPTLSFHGCKTAQSIVADGLIAAGSVFFENHEAYGEIILIGAQIGSDLNCEGVLIEIPAAHKPDVIALVADRSKIAGNVFFRRVRANRTVQLIGAQIGGDLDCIGATFSAMGLALCADRARIEGNVVFTHGFSSAGTVGLSVAEITGQFNCVGAQIAELNCNDMRLAGDLLWTGIREPEKTNLRLFGATIRNLHDDRPSWPAKGKLHIQDFVYQDLIPHLTSRPAMVARAQLAGTSRFNLDDRLDWLDRQPEVEQTNAQPWMQLAKLVEAGGDADGARRVIYVYHRQLARRGNPLMRLATWPYDGLVEQPLRIGAPIVALGVFSYFLYRRAHRMRAMAPTDKEARKEFAASGNVPSGYPPFNPAVYALENVLPVVRLGQDSAWAPDHAATSGNWLPQWLGRLCPFAETWPPAQWFFRLNYRRLALLRWSLILLGWAFALILAAAISSRFKPQ